ncbi:MAG: type IV secretory system conjugative DNA transfer family protein [Chloroflexota bacterium]
MNDAKLNWFQLRFPRDLSEPAVLAALSSFSGVPHGTRLVLDLSATNGGITHRLAVSPAATETAMAGLRAAIPSLRLEAIDAPPLAAGPSVHWQLAPVVAVLRTDALPATAAALLSSLFPLAEDESISLRWSLHSAPRPPLPDVTESQLDGRLRMARAKLALPGMAGHGELRIRAAARTRRTQLMQRVATVLRSLSSPHGRLVTEPYWFGQLGRLFNLRGRYLSVAELAAVIGWPMDAPDLPGLMLGAAKRLVPSAALPPSGRLLGTSDFAGLTRPVALTANASTRGLYVLGPTGTGKTSLLKNLIRDDLLQGRGLVVVETNGDLVRELIDAIPPERIPDVVLLDPTDADYAVGFNPLASAADPSLIADQLGELFQRLWEAFWGPRTAQLTHMGLLTLARRSGSTLLDLPRLYLDPAFRAHVLADLDDPLGLGPDWQWFENLSTREQATVVAPLLNKVRQFTARPAIRAIVGQTEPALSMSQVIDQQKVLLVHLPKGLIGSETAQLLGCLVLTAAWQAAAERAALPPSGRHPFGLYVDEVQDFASAPVPWDEMFAQGRKYGLSLTVAHQNLEQLPKELREVVLANARSKAVFALSATDAKVMERLFAPALTAADLQALDAYSIAAIAALDDGGNAEPVTLTTPPPVRPSGSARQVRETSRTNYARRRAEIESSLRRQLAPERGTGPVRRRRRRPS